MEISTVENCEKIVSAKGHKQVSSGTNWEKSKNKMVCCSTTAAGSYISPLFIFPRKQCHHNLRGEVHQEQYTDVLIMAG